MPQLVHHPHLNNNSTNIQAIHIIVHLISTQLVITMFNQEHQSLKYQLHQIQLWGNQEDNTFSVVAVVVSEAVVPQLIAT